MKLKTDGKPSIKGIHKELMFSKAIPQEPANIPCFKILAEKQRGKGC